jgi:hypothetical protein
VFREVDAALHARPKNFASPFLRRRKLEPGQRRRAVGPYLAPIGSLARKLKPPRARNPTRVGQQHRRTLCLGADQGKPESPQLGVDPAGKYTLVVVAGRRQAADLRVERRFECTWPR